MVRADAALKSAPPTRPRAPARWGTGRRPGGPPPRKEGFGRRRVLMERSPRRGRDSNPRGFRLPLFESGTINHSDTSPHRSLTFECGQTATVSLSISGEYCPTRAEAVSFARWKNARWAAGTFSVLPDQVFCGLACSPRPYEKLSSHGAATVAA